MIHIRNLPDTDLLTDTPELYREATSYLLCCHMELLEHEEEGRSHHILSSVLT